jgi:hypothetical protein
MKIKFLFALFLTGGLFFLKQPLQISATPLKPNFVRLQIFKLSCFAADHQKILEASKEASQLFEKKCGFSIKLPAKVIELEAGADWCFLPAQSSQRIKKTDLMLKKSNRNPNSLALFLTGPTQDSMLSWAYIDLSADYGCGRPDNIKFLKDFGAMFITDFGFKTALKMNQDLEPGQISFLALLIAHEIGHALTNLRHPTQSPRGHLMADALTDLGPELGNNLCECMLASPYLSR